MSTPYVSEIRIFSFGFAPKGWAFCNGQTLAINANQALFALVGTTYGGDGQSNFQLPNLQGRVAVHNGNGFNLGALGGEQSHTLTLAELPTHTHPAEADTASGHNTTSNPSGAFPTDTGGTPAYTTTLASATLMSPLMVASTGGSLAHENRQPFLTLNFCIALQGIFPSRT